MIFFCCLPSPLRNMTFFVWTDAEVGTEVAAEFRGKLRKVHFDLMKDELVRVETDAS